MTQPKLGLYDISIPMMTRMLGNLDTLLLQAEAHASEQGIDPATIVEAQLAADMFPLRRQVQSAADAAKACLFRLAGDKPPSFADTETTFAELHERIAKTVALLNDADAAHVDAGPETITIPTGKETTRSFTRADYLLGFALPNFFFHVAIAHGILRQCGVPVGKLDYLGGR
jgi:hypothetical protein